MGKKLTKEQLLNRLHSGDLSRFTKWYEDHDYEIIDVIHLNSWQVKLLHKPCNTITLRSLDKYKRLQGCKLTECKVSRQKQTCLELYGDENYNNLSKMIKTKMERYNDPFGNRDKIKETISTKDMKAIKNKMVNTRRIKYSGDYVSDRDKSIKSWRLSMKENDTNISSWELEALDKLSEHFSNIKFNYYDELRYPYLCDFYIEDLDLFIELNYHWSHGNEPYIGTPEQLEILEYWKSRKWINNIKVWTIKDVNKRTYAKEHNLNYLEFFNKDEFDNWLSTLDS